MSTATASVPSLRRALRIGWRSAAKWIAGTSAAIACAVYLFLLNFRACGVLGSAVAAVFVAVMLGIAVFLAVHNFTLKGRG